MFHYLDYYFELVTFYSNYHYRVTYAMNDFNYVETKKYKIFVGNLFENSDK